MAIVDAGEIAKNTTGQVDSFKELLVHLIGALGVGLGLVGGKKTFWDSEQQKQQKQGVSGWVLIVGAVFCLSFWTVIQVGQQSLFQTTNVAQYEDF